MGMSDYRGFYARSLKGIKWRSGGEGTAKCPFHDDRKASLSVNQTSGLWYCHACNFGGTAGTFAERLEIEAPAGNKLTAECVFDYRDEKGELLYQVVRFAGKKFRQRRPDQKGKWIWNLDGVRRVPYRLSELIGNSGSVFIVEGEKDVETLRASGFIATCNAGGAGKWRDEYGETLKGRVCIPIADNDGPGRAHAEDVARKLAPYAEKVINLGVLPDSPEHGDVSDWFAAGQTADELLALVDHSEGIDRAAAQPGGAQAEWPAPLDAAAFHGPAGEFVRLVEPHTEADPAALLIQFLVGFGSLVGRSPFRFAGGVAHHLNEYAVVVGDTSRARKGTSWAEVERCLMKVDPEWVAACVSSGLSTGEGLIWHVRDPEAHEDRAAGNGAVRDGRKAVKPDPGASDKRLLVHAGEFAAVLKVSGRDGATLSPVLREAWDGRTLRTLSKNNPATATGAHISMIAHITHEELVRALDSTEAANGFANRFVWACAKRSKQLPWGGTSQEVGIEALSLRVKQAAEQARKGGEFTFDEPAKRKWEAIYPLLTEGAPGLFGAITSRSEAHVLRFACIYAALDAGPAIAVEHLNAAQAVWDFCWRSARYIFGARLGDPDADAILAVLRDQREGLTRTQIRDLFSRHLSGERIDRARDALLRARLIRVDSQGSGGRPVERWTAVGADIGASTQPARPSTPYALRYKRPNATEG